MARKDFMRRNMIKEAFKRFKVPMDAVQDQFDDGSACDRASGDVECPMCHQLYMDHPRVEGSECTIVTCAWKCYHV